MSARFVFVALSSLLLSADLLEWWDEASVLGFLKDVEQFHGPVKLCYSFLCIQLMCYLLISINRIEWQLLVVIFAIYYLDSAKRNFVLMYLGITLATLLFDILYLIKLPEFESMDWVRSTYEGLYVVTYMLKPITMILIFNIWRSGIIDHRSENYDIDWLEKLNEDTNMRQADPYQEIRQARKSRKSHRLQRGEISL